MTRKGSRDSDILRDQYYTCQDEADRLYGIFREDFDDDHYQMVDPSAGKGAFLRRMPPSSVGYDIEPQGEGIEEADFLEVEIRSDRPIAVVGNPPFGRRSQMALKFVNRAARQAEVIAMVLPLTFRKEGTMQKVNSHFRLVREEPVSDYAFTFRGRPYHVPATFQIWVRGDTPRARAVAETRHPDFEFLDGPDGADFVIQRVGARAGMIHYDFAAKPSCHHFIRSKVAEIMSFLDFDRVSRNVAGNPSLSRSEIVTLYKEWFRKCLEGKMAPTILSDCKPGSETAGISACVG